MKRVALVTGADTGIGWAIAQRLQRDGFALGFHTRDDEDDARQQFERTSAKGDAHWLVADLSRRDAGRLVEEAVEALGRLDVLVNNAGLTVSKSALELTAEDFDSIFGVDVRAAFLLAAAAARHMRDHDGGSIVNITSVHEHVPRRGFVLYAGAKAALGMITRGLALELAEFGIRVNAVAPGAIATERNREAGSIAPQIPLGRAGRPDEVASVVSFLASDESSYVTGASYLVDGGFVQHVVP